MIKILILLLLVITQNVLHSQDSTWVRIFGDDEHTIARSLIESYDFGYIISGYTVPPNPPGGIIKDGLIIKTDINGNVLWQKTIGGDVDDKVGGIHAYPTFDGGIIMFGGTYNYGGLSSVFIMKLNACGEREWCKSYVDNDHSQFAIDVLQLPDSSYWAMLSYWGSNLANERIWLFKISQTGETIWQKVYANWNLSTNAEEGRQIIANSENEYLITGDYYESQSGYDTNMRFERPMFIKIDSSGNEIWHTLWVDDFYIGWQAKSVFDTKGDIYSVGKNETYALIDDKPVMHKLSAFGDQLYYKNIEEASKSGGATTISILEDSVLFIGATWKDHDENEHVTVYSTDTLGNILAEKEVLQTSNSFNASLITYDNKLLIVGSFYVDGDWDIYLYKFNRNLEYDSIYTQPLNYDSLCPYQIVSDTIPLDTTTVNLDELYQQMYNIKMYPNPAKTKLNIVIGDFVAGTMLRFYNIVGEKVMQYPLINGQKMYEIDISYLQKGLYLIILYDKNTILNKKKIVVSK